MVFLTKTSWEEKTYDAKNNLTSYVSGDYYYGGSSTSSYENSYDRNGDLTQVIEYGDNGEKISESVYSWDAEGHMVVTLTKHLDPWGSTGYPAIDKSKYIVTFNENNLVTNITSYVLVDNQWLISRERGFEGAAIIGSFNEISDAVNLDFLLNKSSYNVKRIDYDIVNGKHCMKSWSEHREENTGTGKKVEVIDVSYRKKSDGEYYYSGGRSTFIHKNDIQVYSLYEKYDGENWIPSGENVYELLDDRYALSEARYIYTDGVKEMRTENNYLYAEGYYNILYCDFSQLSSYGNLLFNWGENVRKLLEIVSKNGAYESVTKYYYSPLAASGIEGIYTDTNVGTQTIYDIHGRRQNTLVRNGINIVKDSNGGVRKIFVK